MAYMQSSADSVVGLYQPCIAGHSGYVKEPSQKPLNPVTWWLGEASGKDPWAWCA